MSMGGFVAIGLVIDDAVVVVENIHRRSGEAAAPMRWAATVSLWRLSSDLPTTVAVLPARLLSGVVLLLQGPVNHTVCGGAD